MSEMIGLEVKILPEYAKWYSQNGESELVGQIGTIRSCNGDEYFIQVPGKGCSYGMTRSCFETLENLAFGKNAWVYCCAHVKPHLTGWCGVGNHDKIGLGIFGQENAKEAYAKCEEWGLKV